MVYLCRYRYTAGCSRYNNIIRHHTGANHRRSRCGTPHTTLRTPGLVNYDVVFSKTRSVCCILFTAESRSLLDSSRVIVERTRDFSAGILVADSAPQSLSEYKTNCRRRRAAVVSFPLYIFFVINNRALYNTAVICTTYINCNIFLFYNNTGRDLKT